MPVETSVRTVSGPLSTVSEARIWAIPQGAEPGFDPGVPLDDLLAFHAAKGEPGEIIATPVVVDGAVHELLLYGTGDGSPAALRKAGAALVRRARGQSALAVLAPGAGSCALDPFLEGALLAGYDFGYKTGGKKPLTELLLITEDEGSGRGQVIAQAVALAKDLANEHAVDKCPEWLADRAAEVAATTGLQAKIWDEQALADDGFGGILAVGAGSARPPRLIQLTYAPEGATRHIVLVGKGITFDTGGLSLKPSDGMKTMKTDMTGGAVVIGVLSALRALDVPVKVTGLIASAENMPSGSAMRPSDVITHFGGITSEVLNTDAEGRLVLADALAYSDAVLAPDTVVDIATLTGAAKVALGLKHGALFATDDTLAQELTAAGTAVDEPLWRLPLTDDYRDAISSDVADVANIERRGFGGGSIMAALFLEKFAGSQPWAHLDIAGPARGPEGSTGYGVRLLLDWLTADTGI
ncbi:M17 family metallopeptidase [Actinocorallia lasiicapitis]